MAFTVSAVNDQYPGISLYVAVLTGATEAGGNSAASMGSGVLNTSFTPTYTNSLVVVSLGNLSSETIFTLEPNESNWGTPFSDSTNHWCGQPVYYTGTVTGGTPFTVGATAPSLNPTGYAIYEVRASGGSTPATDASSVGASSVTNTATTAPFAPPAGAVLVLMVAENGTGTGGTTTITDTSGLGLSWTPRASASGAWVYTTVMTSGTAASAGLAAATAAAWPGDTSGPYYAGAASDLGGGAGSWANPGNADGAPDGSVAVWTV